MILRKKVRLAYIILIGNLIHNRISLLLYETTYMRPDMGSGSLKLLMLGYNPFSYLFPALFLYHREDSS